MDIFQIKTVEELEDFIEKKGNIYEELKFKNALFYDNAQQNIELFKTLIDYGLVTYLTYGYHAEDISHYILDPHIIPVIKKYTDFNYVPEAAGPLIQYYVHNAHILRELINHGLDIEQKCVEHEETVLFSNQISKEVVSLLIEKKINVHHKNASGQNFLFATDSLILTQHAIREGLDVNDVDMENNSAIMLNKNDDIVKYLIKNNANINHLNKHNENVLFCRENNIEMLKFLVENGVDIHVKSTYGHNALCFCKNTEEAAYLISQGIQIEEDCKEYFFAEVERFVNEIVKARQEKQTLEEIISDSISNRMLRRL